MDLGPAELHGLERFREAAEAWGWRWRLTTGGTAPDQAAGAAVLTRAAAVLGTPLNATELQARRLCPFQPLVIR
jgi:hypothetical protein